MPHVIWPDHLVEQIARGRWILFIGAGVARSCRNAAGDHPPSWDGLLSRLASRLTNEVNRAKAEELIAGGDLLAAADHIKWSFSAEHNVNGYLNEIRLAVTGDPADPFWPSEMYTTLIDLNPQVVFTTNYDTLFEQASLHAFSVVPYHVGGLSSQVRRGEPVLVKVHGTVDAIHKIVLTQRDFNWVAEEGGEVLAVLSALSLTQTILFVGYRLADPDIQLVVRNAASKPLDPEAHFVLAEEQDVPSLPDVFRECWGVSVLSFPQGNFAACQEALEDLRDIVLEKKAALGL